MICFITMSKDSGPLPPYHGSGGGCWKTIILFNSLTLGNKGREKKWLVWEKGAMSSAKGPLRQKTYLFLTPLGNFWQLEFPESQDRVCLGVLFSPGLPSCRVPLSGACFWKNNQTTRTFKLFRQPLPKFDWFLGLKQCSGKQSVQTFLCPSTRLYPKRPKGRVLIGLPCGSEGLRVRGRFNDRRPRGWPNTMPWFPLASKTSEQWQALTKRQPQLGGCSCKPPNTTQLLGPEREREREREKKEKKKQRRDTQLISYRLTWNPQKYYTF